jgi:uncharacterized protein
MHDHPFIAPLVGGAIIGLSASLLLLFNGRVAGTSGILAGLLAPKAGEIGWRAAFVAGLVLGGVVLAAALPGAFDPAASAAPLGLVIVAGFLVGFGTRLGSGCTSGHGVCGVSRMARRSIVATMTFIAAGVITVYVHNHLLGGSS